MRLARLVLCSKCLGEGLEIFTEMCGANRTGHSERHSVYLRHLGECAHDRARFSRPNLLQVTDIQLQYFDTVPVANALCILKSGFLFCASEFGNQYVAACLHHTRVPAHTARTHTAVEVIQLPITRVLKAIFGRCCVCLHASAFRYADTFHHRLSGPLANGEEWECWGIIAGPSWRRARDCLCPH